MISFSPELRGLKPNPVALAPPISSVSISIDRDADGRLAYFLGVLKGRALRRFGGIDVFHRVACCTLFGEECTRIDLMRIICMKTHVTTTVLLLLPVVPYTLMVLSVHVDEAALKAAVAVEPSTHTLALF